MFTPDEARRAERNRLIQQEIATVVHNPAAYRKAAEIIRTKGHTREVFASTAPHDQGGQPCNIEDPQASCFCIMGALVRAGVELDLIHPQVSLSHWNGDWSDGDTYGFAMIYDATRVMDLPRAANAWNNNKNRTADEVIAALEAGADYLEQEEHA